MDSAIPAGSRSARTIRWTGRADIQGRSSCLGILQSECQRGDVEIPSDFTGLDYANAGLSKPGIDFLLFSRHFRSKEKKFSHRGRVYVQDCGRGKGGVCGPALFPDSISVNLLWHQQLGDPTFPCIRRFVGSFCNAAFRFRRNGIGNFYPIIVFLNS